MGRPKGMPPLTRPARRRGHPATCHHAPFHLRIFTDIPRAYSQCAARPCCATAENVELHSIVDSRTGPPTETQCLAVKERQAAVGEFSPVVWTPGRREQPVMFLRGRPGARQWAHRTANLPTCGQANYCIRVRREMNLVALWREVLGENSDPSLSFTSNGGDSFQAVLISVHVSELWHVEIDYLDVLETPNAMALADLVKHAPPDT